MRITAVLTSRNDSPVNHRVKISLQSFIDHFDEVILVDYNSINEPLKNVLDLTYKGNLRIIEVSHSFCKETHPAFPDKFIEVYARNIGIRRANSPYIVSSNIDIVTEKPVSLMDDVMYTVRRYNVPESDTILRYDGLKMNKHLYNKMPMAVTETGEPCWDPGDFWSLVVGCGDFQIANKDIWYKIKGFEEKMTGRAYADTNVMKKAELAGYFISVLDHDVFHLDHPTRATDNKANLNDQKKWVQDFRYSENTDNWGFSDVKFQETIL